MSNGCLLSSIVLALLALLFIPVSSDVSPGQAPPTPQIAVATNSDALLAQLDAGLVQWEAQGTDSYTISVQAGSIWHLQTHTIVVTDGVVTDSSAVCSPAPTEGGTCEVNEFDPNDFTVPGLFAQANDAAVQDAGQWTTLEFDPAYGFPSTISYNDPDVYDEEWWWRVTSFESLD